MPRTITFAAVLPFAAALLAGGASAAAGEGDGHGAIQWHRTAGAAIADAETTGRPILVDLYADWCGWCKRLDRQTFSDPGFQAWAAGRFALLRLDVEDGGEGSRLRQRFGARGLPTTLIVDSRLARIGAVHGFKNAPEMIAGLEAELDRHRRLIEEYRRTMADGDRPALAALADTLHQSGDGRRAAAIYQKLLAGEPPGDRARLELALADARRLALDYDGAEQALTAARASARAAGGEPRLAEAMALLDVLIARDRGDCERVTEAVESLLARHPKSRASIDAVSALRSLENDPDGGCT
jgi:thioredoxin-like negative regulator of GroEL